MNTNYYHPATTVFPVVPNLGRTSAQEPLGQRPAETPSAPEQIMRMSISTARDDRIGIVPRQQHILSTLYHTGKPEFS